MGGLRSILDPGGLTGGDELFSGADVLGIGARGRAPGGKKGGPAPNPSADALAKIATETYQQTQPIRTGLIDRSNAFLSGDLDVTNTPMFLGMKNAADSQFARARDNTIARTAPGGSLSSALADLEFGRANTLTQGAGQIAGDEISRAFGLATGSVPNSTSGLGQAANIQQQSIAAQQAQQAAGKQAAGQGAGILLASFLA